MKFNFKILAFLLVIIISVNLEGCSLRKKIQEINPNAPVQVTLDSEQEKNADIKTDVLKNRELQLEITIPAQFKAIYNSTDRIYSPIEGKVINVFVEPGQVVKKGQALVEVKSDIIGQIQLEFLDNIIQVDSEIKQGMAQLDLSRQAYNRENILFKEKISSRSEYEIARAQMLKDSANLSSLRIKKSAMMNVYQQRLSLYGADAGIINRVSSTKRIQPTIMLRANKNGILLARMVNPGEYIEANKELFNLADLAKIWLVGYAFEKDAPFLKDGQEVSATLEDTKDVKINGKLIYVSAILDPQAKTLEVRAEIPNKDMMIKPNMYAQMFVDIGKANKLAIPNKSLQNYGDCILAYVKVKPNIYEERKVKIGQKNEQYAEVISGVKAGEEVVTNGAFSVLGEALKQKEQ